MDQTRIIHICINVFILISLTLSGTCFASRCLFVSSYHSGYEWSDGVERGLRVTLHNKCEFKKFDMDTKRHKDEESKRDAAIQAKNIIEDWQPDVVITADDNAAKYLIQPHYKDHETPFVFCGINWNADGYGFPYKNTTGMIEIAPIDILFRKVQNILGGARSAAYIGADTLTEKKNLNRFISAAENHRVNLKSYLVSTTEEWIEAYKAAQLYDFVVIGSNSGIKNWNQTEIKNTIRTHTQQLSTTNHGWMMPYTLLGFTKIPEEQGEWAGQVALAILDGAVPSDIPIVSNKKWDIWINDAILTSSGVEIPDKLLRKAKKVAEHESL
jgi:ABC-type uncharacterized transport system substrate-binding protein